MSYSRIFKNSLKDFLKKGIASIFAFASLLQPAIAIPLLPPAQTSTEQILRMKEQMTTTAERVVKGKLLEQGISAQDSSVTVDFDFDKEKLRADSLQYYQKWYETSTQTAEATRKQEFETQKTDIKELAKLLGYNSESKEPEKTNNTVNLQTAGQRLGTFNLDLLGMSFPDPTTQTTSEKAQNTKNEAHLPFTLGIQLSARSASTEPPPPFTFDISEYITDVRISIILPNAATDALGNDVRKLVSEALGLQSKIEENLLTEKIKITKAPAPKEEAKESYIDQLVSPKSGLIPAVAAALVAGTLLLVAAFLLLSGLSKLAMGLGELKPKEVATAGSSDSSKDEASSTSTSVVQQVVASGTAGGEGNKDNRSDPNAVSRLLAADMGLVRTQIAEIVKHDENAVAEVLRDFVRGESGLSDLKDLVTFVGFEVLNPALNALPKKLLSEFSAYIEDSGDEPTNPLNGIELAQRLNREYVARRTKNAADDGDLIKSLRRELVLIEDETLGKVFSTVDTQECILLFKTLSLERAQSFIKKIPTEVFREAYMGFDNPLANVTAIAQPLLAKISEAKKDASTKGTVGQKRIMLRILKNATPDDEEFIQSLVANDDWDMKSLIMKTRFLFRDLPYVQPALVKQAFEAFPVAFRGELAFCSSENNRKVFMNLYAEGARARELLSAEIDQIEKNDKRRALVEKSKNNIIQQFLDSLHGVLSADPQNYEEIIVRQSQENGEQSPSSSDTEKSQNTKAA